MFSTQLESVNNSVLTLIGSCTHAVHLLVGRLHHLQIADIPHTPPPPTPTSHQPVSIGLMLNAGLPPPPPRVNTHVNAER
jgi:hypothetical protein